MDAYDPEVQLVLCGHCKADRPRRTTPLHCPWDGTVQGVRSSHQTQTFTMCPPLLLSHPSKNKLPHFRLSCPSSSSSNWRCSIRSVSGASPFCGFAFQIESGHLVKAPKSDSFLRLGPDRESLLLGKAQHMFTETGLVRQTDRHAQILPNPGAIWIVVYFSSKRRHSKWWKHCGPAGADLS